MSTRGHHFQVDQGGYLVEGLLQRLGDDLLLCIWGGRSHIGAVAMAQPRPSLADPKRVSATASVFCYVGHKEDEVVKMVSERLAAALQTKVVVVAGLHWDDLSREEIDQVMANVGTLTEIVIQAQGGARDHE